MPTPTESTADHSDEEFESRLRTQRIAALLLCVWGLGMAAYYASIEAPWVLTTCIAATSLVGMAIALAIRWIGVTIASLLHTVMLGVALALVLLFYGGVSNHTSAWLVALPVVSLFQGNRSFARVLFVVVIVGVGVMLAVEELGWLPEPVLDAVQMRRVSAGSAVVLTLLILVMGMVADGGIRRRNEALAVANHELAREIDGHLATQKALREAQAEVVEAARLAGRAEVATGALHNIGNALNSVTVSTARSLALLRQRRVSRLDALAGLLDELDDPRYAAYVRRVAVDQERGRAGLIEELEHAQTGVQHVVRVVDLQQAVARHGGLNEPVDVADSVQAAALLVGLPPTVPLTVDGDVGTVIVDRHRLLQILANLLKNAREANANRIDVVLVRDASDVVVTVTDDGDGIDPTQLTTIFAHGFTTKAAGSGFGLHASALAAKEVGGSLEARSEGVGRGAVFELRLPLDASTGWDDPSGDAGAAGAPGGGD